VVFHARDLSKTYTMGEVQVYAPRDVNLDIYEGEFIVLLGPSGSVKSILLNILCGLDAATGGEARWRDHDLVGADDAELTRYRREHVGFVFQFYNLIPSLTVLENVALVNEIADHPLDPRQALALVGLDQRRDILAMRGQVITIALVVAAGMAVFVALAALLTGKRVSQAHIWRMDQILPPELNDLEFEALRQLAAHPTARHIPGRIQSRLKDIGYAKEVLGGIVLTEDGLQRISQNKL